MKYLQILNASVLAFGAAMGVILAVVCLLYAVHLETEPQLRGQMAPLLGLTAWFLAVGLAAGAAFLGHRRSWPGRWVVQLLPLVPIGGVAHFLWSLRG